MIPKTAWTSILAGVLCILWSPPLAVGYEGAVVADAGSIGGRVVVTGTVEPLPPQPVFKNKDVCGATTLDERLVVGSGGALRYAVVHLEGIRSGKPLPGSRPVVLDNDHCAFVPHVLSASVGQKLEIRNSDPLLHDAHAWLGTRTLFNVGVPKGRTVTRVLEDPGLIHINCNVLHTWMHAYLFVADHPYHAVTDAEGRFELPDVPPGRYTLTTWHELLGSAHQDVTVQAGQETTVDVGLTPEPLVTP